MLLRIIRTEAPVAIDLATRRLMAHWQLSRQTSRVDRHVRTLLRELTVQQQIVVRDGFLWRADQNPDQYAAIRVPAPDDPTPRQPEELPPEEIANACLAVLRQQVSLPTEDLLREVARLFGFARLTERVQIALQRGIEVGLRRGDFHLQDDRAVLSR